MNPIKMMGLIRSEVRVPILAAIMLAALVGAVVLLGPAQAAPVHAQESNIVADCEFWATNPGEGDNYRVTISAEDENAHIAGWWHTVAHPATSSVPGAAAAGQDYVDVQYQWQEGRGSVTGEFSTIEDGYAERLELLTIRFENALEGGEDVECEIAIWDDDVGVIEVNITSSPADGHTYRTGETIEIALTFNRHTKVRGEVLLDLRLGDASDASRRVARYHRHTGAIVYFRYQVRPGDFDDNGISLDGGYIDEDGEAHGIGGSGRVLPSGDYRYDSFSPWWHGIGDQAGHKVSGSRVAITATEIVSTPASGDTYGVGDTIEISATFNGEVNVVSGDNPGLGLWVGSNWRSAFYLRGSGTDTLVFGYTVRAGDSDGNGISMDGGYQDENGRWHNFINHSNIIATGTTITPDRAYPGLPHNPAHKVDAVKPTISSATVAANGATVTIAFTEDIQVSPLLQWFIDNEGTRGVPYFVNAVLNVEVNNTWPTFTGATVSGNTATLTLQTPVSSGESVEVRYDGVFANAVPGVLMDMIGNAMTNFPATAATNNSTVTAHSGAGNVVLGSRELTITEGNSSSYTVKLGSQPSGDVTVAIASNAPSNVTISETGLTFTPDNWDTAQTVTVSSTADDKGYGYWVGIRHTASGSGFTGEDTLRVLMEE